MPYATALTLAALDLTTNILPASSTIPVRSRTPLADKLVSNSMYSAALGVDVVDIAICTVAAVDPLLQTLTVSTVNVSAGQVYTEVLVAAARSFDPNLPVAIIYFSVVFSLKRS